MVSNGNREPQNKWIPFAEAVGLVAARTGISDPAPGLEAALSRGAIRHKGQDLRNESVIGPFRLEPRGTAYYKGDRRPSDSDGRWLFLLDVEGWVAGLKGDAVQSTGDPSHYRTGASGRPTAKELALFGAHPPTKIRETAQSRRLKSEALETWAQKKLSSRATFDR